MTRRLSLALTLALAIGCASKVKPPTADVSVVGDANSVVTGTLVQVDGSKSTDPQNLTLAFRWFLRSVPAGSAAKLNATDVMSPSFLADVTGEYEVALVVSDGIYSSGVGTRVITALPCGGHSPQVSKITFTQGTTTASANFAVAQDDAGTPDAGEVVDAGGDGTDAGTTDAGPADAGAPDAGPVDAGPRDAGPQALFREIDIVKLSAAIIDPDTDATACTPAAPAVYTYRWSLQAPAGSLATLSDQFAATPTFAPDVAGNYIAAVQATDLSGRTGPVVSTTLVVADCGDHPPSVIVATVSVQARVNGALTGTGTAALNAPVSLVGTGSDLDNGVGPVSHVNCNPTGKNNQVVTLDWSFVAVPFGSHAALGVTSIPALGSEAVSSTAVFYPDVPGNYVVRLTGADSTGRAGDPSLVVINVGGCTGNHQPLIPAVRAVDSNGNGLPNGQIAVGQAVAFQVSPPGPSDADNVSCTPLQTFTYAWTLVNQPAGSRATLNNPTLAAPGIIADVPGTYTARVVVTDSTGLSSLPATIGFVAANPSNICGGRSPTVSARIPGGTTSVTWHSNVQLQADSTLPSAQNPTCNGACTSLFTVDDLDASPTCQPGIGLSFAWSFDALPSGSQAAFFNPNVQNPSFVPDVANADYFVRLTVTDTRGLTATGTARLHTPAAGANAPQVTFNSAIATAPLGFTAAGGATPASITGAQVGQAVAITLAKCSNNLPQVTDADNSISVCAVNPGPQTFSYAWTLVSAPAGSSGTILNAATASPSIVPDVAGTYRLRVVVTDSTGLASAPVDLQIPVAGCDATVKPALSGVSVSPGGTAVVGVGQQLSVAVTNVDSNSVYTGGHGCVAPEQFTYDWHFVSLPAGSFAVLNDPTARQPGFVPDLVSGTWIVGVTVSDSEGRSTSATATVSTGTCGAQSPTITNVTAGADFNTYNGVLTGSDPSVTWDGNGNVSAGTAVFQLGTPIALNATARDNDNSCGAPTQTLRYSWALQSLPSGSGATLNASGATASLVPDVPSALASSTTLTADYKVALTVTDSTGRSTTTIYSMAVSNCGSFFPVVTNVTATPATGAQVRAGLGLSLSAAVTNANISSCIPAQFRLPTVYSNSWSVLRRPAGSEAELVGLGSFVPSFTPDVVGRYDFGFQAIDAAGKVSASFQQTVNAVP